MWQLITIPFSHYCEKARWGLDYTGCRYVERPYLPGLHLMATALRGRGKTVPMLRADAETLTDSTAILEHADRTRAASVASLYGDDAATRQAVAALEDELDESLGPASRVVAYHYLLPRVGTLTRIVGDTYAPPGKMGLRTVMPVLRPAILSMYRIDEKRVERSVTVVRDLFRQLDARLTGEGSFLVGSRFSAADITLASLATPALLWPEMLQRYDRAPSALDPLPHLPEPYARLVAELRATRTGAYCRRLYTAMRQRPASAT